jgi:hypothetical protein
MQLTPKRILVGAKVVLGRRIRHIQDMQDLPCPANPVLVTTPSGLPLCAEKDKERLDYTPRLREELVLTAMSFLHLSLLVMGHVVAVAMHVFHTNSLRHSTKVITLLLRNSASPCPVLPYMQW